MSAGIPDCKSGMLPPRESGRSRPANHVTAAQGGLVRTAFSETASMDYFSCSATPHEEHCAQPAGSTLLTIGQGRPNLLPSDQRGRTYIDDEVVAIIARLAAENVEGVHQLGESSLRAMFSGSRRHQGVDAEVGMKEAAVDVEIIVEFGYPIRAVSQKLRQEIIESVERMAGRSVVEVNVYVIDVHVSKPERHRRRELE